MNTPPEPRIQSLTARGIVVEPTENGRLRVHPASLLTDDERGWLREHAGEVLAHLTRPPETLLLAGSEQWELDEAIRLMAEADELPSLYGVSGTHPDVQRAAAMVVSAFQTRDIGTVCFAVAEFAVEVRRVAGRRCLVERSPRSSPPAALGAADQPA